MTSLDSPKWYRRNRWIILLLVFSPPLGIALVWLTSNWSQSVKITATTLSSFLLLMYLASASGKSQQPPVSSGISSSPVATPSPSPMTKTQAAKESCGDSGTADNWYPVFIDGGNLSEIQSKFCKDAIAKSREKTGKPTVQLASFSDRARAESFAKTVGGEVGDPYQAKSEKEKAVEKPTEKIAESPAVDPLELENSNPKTDEDRFLITLLSQSPKASVRVGIDQIGRSIYSRRREYFFRHVTNQESPAIAVMNLQEALANSAIKENFHWGDYLTTYGMAEAIIRGMYQWEREHPGDLDPSNAPQQSQQSNVSRFSVARIIDPPSNCRESADKSATVLKVYQEKTSVQVGSDAVNSDWYFVPSDRCFIHRSQISFNN